MTIICLKGKKIPNIRLHYFPFRSPHPIAGVFLSGDDVAINSKLNMPKEMKLFLSLHESKHADQHKEGDFDEKEKRGLWERFYKAKGKNGEASEL